MSDIDFTQWASMKMDEFSEKIYEIDDGICSIEDNEEAIIDYLKSIQYTNTVGLQLRRYMCDKFSSGFDKQSDQYRFVLSSGKEISVKNYLSESYSLENDDVLEYAEVFTDINQKFNSDSEGNLVLDFPKAETRRLLRADKRCTRSKIFLLSFALHMSIDDVNKFLTDTLAEQSYNFRNPNEVIAFFCQSHDEYNSYFHYLNLVKQYEIIAKQYDSFGITKEDYTRFASMELTMFINTEEDLINFLKNNIANFNSYSQTLYSELCSMIDELIFSGYCKSDYEISLMDKSLRPEARKKVLENANVISGIENTEQLARKMLEFIPRATSECEKDGKIIYTNDFITVNNSDTGKKQKTTNLPSEITINLLMKDRLDDLIRHIKQIERKDIVFLKFYLFSLEIAEREYTSGDYRVFMDECNDMLQRCGMSQLYLANRFENLIMLSLLSQTPFDMFSDIIEYSFFNEPEHE